MSAARNEVRVRRSELATPASNQKMLKKAVTLGADLVFMDLEDACAPSMKVEARANAISMLRDYEWGQTIRAVRVNGLDTHWCLDDVVDIVTNAGMNLDIIIIPKARSGRDVWWFHALLTQLENKLGLNRQIGLEVLIEEAEALENAEDIATSCTRIEALILGAGDLSASLHARVDPNFQPKLAYEGDLWSYARSKVVTAARIAGVDAIDYPFPNFQDSESFRRSCDQASVHGFDGKWCIHPDQIRIANESFSPTPDEVAWAVDMQMRYRTAEESGTGAISMDGMLVDAAHMRHVNTVLRRAQRCD